MDTPVVVRAAWREMAGSVASQMDEYTTWTVAATTAAIGLTVSALPDLATTVPPSALKTGILFLGVSVGAGAAAKHAFVRVRAAIKAKSNLQEALGLPAVIPHSPVEEAEIDTWKLMVSPLVQPFRWSAFRGIKNSRMKGRHFEWTLMRTASVGTRLFLLHVLTAVAGFTCIALAL